MGSKLIHFIKKEPVFAIAALCTLVSAVFVPPGPAYWSYIDFRVLFLLFCLMAVVAGVQKYGLFSRLAGVLLQGNKSFRFLWLILVLLPFFSSMLITNDVALLTFVPFAILVLRIGGKEDRILEVIVFQTIAANLGSMLTPVGNPQNLYLYSHYSMGMGEFLKAVVPFGLLSLLAFLFLAFFRKREPVAIAPLQSPCQWNGKRILCYGALFVLCLCSVFHLLPSGALFGIVFLAVWLLDRELIFQMDYVLLGTFVCFFIFAGNLGKIELVAGFFEALMEKAPLLASAAASQVMSNVPAAVLLSGFTQNGTALLLGTDLGGLGTPIASLASLISMRFYMQLDHSRPGRFLAVFLAFNFLFLAVLLGAAKWAGFW